MKKKNYKLAMGLLFSISLTCFSVGCGVASTSQTSQENTMSKSEIASSDQNDVHTYGDAVEDKQKARQKLSQISDSIQLAPYESVYIGYHGESVVKQSKPMRAASMIKVYILGYLFEEVEAGRISLNETILLQSSDQVGGAGILSGYSVGTALTVDELAKLMITVSDNTATNILIHRLGMENINTYIVKHGYTDTKLQRNMMDLTAIEEGRENYTSAKDLGTWFMNLLDGKNMSGASREKMLTYLLGQTDTETFNEALPNRSIAHKTGELGGVYHDGGIIFQNHDGNKENAYVLITLSDPYQLRGAEIYHFRNIATYVDDSIF